MPLFEFVCSQCGTPFEELVRSSSSIEGVRCPACDSSDVKKKISMFASRSSSSGLGSFSAPAASCSSGSV